MSPLQPSRNARERSLLIGSYGTGKSSAWVKIAEWLAKTNSPGKVYVLDTDRSAEYLIEGEPFEDRVKITDIASYPQLKEQIDKVDPAKSRHSYLTRDDWFVIDSIDKNWEFAQDYFTEQAFGVDVSDWFLQYRKEHSTGGHPLASDYGSNWVVINKFNNAIMGPLQRLPCHVLCTSPAEPLTRPETNEKTGKTTRGDSPELLDLYSGIGVKPKGQKSLGYQFHSILLVEKKISTHLPTKYTLTNVVKDRKRVEVRGFELSEPFGFVKYLREIAGWSL